PTTLRPCARPSQLSHEIPPPPAAPVPCAGAAATTEPCGGGLSSRLLGGRIEQQTHGAGERVPFRLLGDQLLPAFRSDAIVAGTLALVRHLPGRRGPAFPLEPIR